MVDDELKFLDLIGHLLESGGGRGFIARRQLEKLEALAELHDLLAQLVGVDVKNPAPYLPRAMDLDGLAQGSKAWVLEIDGGFSPYGLGGFFKCFPQKLLGELELIRQKG